MRVDTFLTGIFYYAATARRRLCHFEATFFPSGDSIPRSSSAANELNFDEPAELKQELFLGGRRFP